MWFFRTNNERIIELSSLIQEWVFGLDEVPRRRDIHTYLDVAKELLLIYEKMHRPGLNAVSRHLVEALRVWCFEAGRTNYTLHDSPSYKNVVHYAERLESVISRAD